MNSPWQEEVFRSTAWVSWFRRETVQTSSSLKNCCSWGNLLIPAVWIGYRGAFCFPTADHCWKAESTESLPKPQHIWQFLQLQFVFPTFGCSYQQWFVSTAVLLICFLSDWISMLSSPASVSLVMFVIYSYLCSFLQHKMFQVEKQRLVVLSQVGDHVVWVQLRLIFTLRPLGEDVNAHL